MLRCIKDTKSARPQKDALAAVVRGFRIHAVLHSIKFDRKDTPFANFAQIGGGKKS